MYNVGVAALRYLHSNAGRVAVALVLLWTSFFLLYHLGVEPIQDYDEATYAEVVHEALAQHDFLSFTYGGARYFKKPPLMFWSMGVSESLIGESAFAMRLPFALSGIALIAVLMLAAYEISGDAWAAALAGAIAATTSPLVETARQVRMDVPVVLCIVAAFYFFLRGLKNSRWFLAFGAAVGLAILAKSVIAFFAGVAALSLIVCYRRFDVFRNRHFWWGVCLCLLVALPWHLWEIARFGPAFLAQYVGFEVIARAQRNLFWTVTITNGDYIRYLSEFALPWLWLFFAALGWLLLGWRAIENHTRTAMLACALTVFSIAAVFFTAATKAPTYLMPLYPFAALFMALGAFSVASLSRVARILACCAALMLLAWAAPFALYNAYHHNPYYSVYLALAENEKTIGFRLAQLPPDQTFYVYDDENLGSIMFYSQHLHPLALSASEALPSGSFIVVDTADVPQLRGAFPALRAAAAYSGSQVTLLETR